MAVDIDYIIEYKPQPALRRKRDPRIGGFLPQTTALYAPVAPPARSDPISVSTDPPRPGLVWAHGPAISFPVIDSRSCGRTGGVEAGNVELNNPPPWNEFNVLLKAAAVSALEDQGGMIEAVKKTEAEGSEACNENTAPAPALSLKTLTVEPEEPMVAEPLAGFAANPGEEGETTLKSVEIPDSRPTSAGSLQPAASAGPPADDLKMCTASDCDGASPIALAHSGRSICGPMSCSVSVVVPRKTTDLDSVAGIVGTEQYQIRTETTPKVESPESILKDDFGEDSNPGGDDDNEGSDFNPEADIPVAEPSSLLVSLPPNSRAGISSCAQHQAISNIPMSGWLKVHLDRNEPQYTLTLLQVVRPSADWPSLTSLEISRSNNITDRGRR
ncbi:MAG: hypothetical protein Q9160_009269 [Pyrenula sp. 1 TL-2023]